jgi:hypothetical protein
MLVMSAGPGRIVVGMTGWGRSSPFTSCACCRRRVLETAMGAKSLAVKRAVNPRAVELRPFAEVHKESSSHRNEAKLFVQIAGEILEAGIDGHRCHDLARPELTRQLQRANQIEAR